MISAHLRLKLLQFQALGFSAIARSVMISALKCGQTNRQDIRFSAIARSVMISAGKRHDYFTSCLPVSVL